MNTLLFSLHNVLVAMDGHLGSFDVDDEEYSCTWDVHRAGQDSIAMIDIKSIRRKVWRRGKASWVTARIDAPTIEKMEERLQAQVEREEADDRSNVREVARGYA